MPEKTISRCASCGYPLTAEFTGQTASCPNCSSINEAISQGITIPTPLFIGVLAFGLGVFLGPAILASTTEGAKYLEEQARAGLRR